MAKQNPVDEAKELQTMLVDYAKQETVEPLKTLGRYLSAGLGGAVLIFMGVMFVGLGVLRVLQSQTGDAFEGLGFLSLVPYLGSMLVMSLLVLVILLAMSKATKAVR
ncbi:MAG: hypothetical protein ACN4GZ_14645 [Acidimicrobiales bacterium]